MRDIRALRDDGDLAWALAEVEVYFNAPPVPGTSEADRFDVLSDLIEAYESRNHPVEAVEAVDMLKAFLDLSGRSQSDLADLLGSRSRASEILNRKRPLTLEMIRRLHDVWGLPAEALIRQGASAAA